VIPNASTEVTIEDYYSSDDNISSQSEQLPKSGDLNKNTKALHVNNVLERPKKQKLNVKSTPAPQCNQDITTTRIIKQKPFLNEIIQRLHQQSDHTEVPADALTAYSNDDGISIGPSMVINSLNTHKNQKEKCSASNVTSHNNNVNYNSDDEREYLKKLRHGETDLVRTTEILPYRSLNRKLEPRTKKHYRELKKSIKTSGIIKTPLMLAIDMQKGRAQINDGNHRIAIAKELKIEWVPVRVHRLPLERKNSLELPHWPRDWPFSYACPCDFGFDTKENKYGKLKKY